MGHRGREVLEFGTQYILALLQVLLLAPSLGSLHRHELRLVGGRNGLAMRNGGLASDERVLGRERLDGLLPLRNSVSTA